MSIKNLISHFESFYNTIDNNYKYICIIDFDIYRNIDIYTNIQYKSIDNNEDNIYKQLQKNIKNLNNFSLTELNYIKTLNIEEIKNLIKIYDEWFCILYNLQNINHIL